MQKSAWIIKECVEDYLPAVHKKEALGEFVLWVTCWEKWRSFNSFVIFQNVSTNSKTTNAHWWACTQETTLCSLSWQPGSLLWQGDTHRRINGESVRLRILICVLTVWEERLSLSLRDWIGKPKGDWRCVDLYISLQLRNCSISRERRGMHEV